MLVGLGLLHVFNRRMRLYDRFAGLVLVQNKFDELLIVNYAMTHILN